MEQRYCLSQPAAILTFGLVGSLVFSACVTSVPSDRSPESSASQQTASTGLTASATPAGQQTGLVVGSGSGIYNATDFGAVGDGKHDDTNSFRAAIAAAGVSGGTVLVRPVGGTAGSGYVLTGTVRVPPGVALVGSLGGFTNNVWGSFDLPESHVKGAKILARPAQMREPLFQIEGGATVRGFWILYDQQPMPADDEFRDTKSPYYYASFEQARSRFIREHVKPYGPTFYLTNANNVTIQDIVADRYYDFLFAKAGARLLVDHVQLYGYNKGFVIQESYDVNRISHVLYVPDAGPTCPCERGGKKWSWVYAIIVSQPTNVVLHVGTSDGWDLHDLYFFGAHTGIRIGASAEYPIHDPLTDAVWTNAQTTGGQQTQAAWGSISNVGLDQVAVGFHFVWPTGSGNQISNLLIFPAFSDGSGFQATTGTGRLAGVARQAAFLFEPTFRDRSAPSGTSLLVSNFTVVATNDPARFFKAAGSANDINGRVFLVGGDVTMEIFGFSLIGYPEALLIAAAPTAGDVSIRIRGYLSNGVPQDDKKIDRNGVAALR